MRKGRQKVAWLLGGMAGCVLIGVLGVALTASSLSRYHSLVIDNRKVNAFIMRVQDPNIISLSALTKKGKTENRKKSSRRYRSR